MSNNWHLSFIVIVVSICSLVLIQQYVVAQGGWVDPNSLPGVTPSNVFVVNPLADDLQLNNHNIFGANIEVRSGDSNNVLTIKNNKNLCLTKADGTLDCRNTWPVVTGGITGAGTVGTIPIFTGASTIGDSTLKNVGGNRYKVDAQSGGLWVTSNNTSYNPLQINLTDFFQANYNGLDITNTGNGGSIKITDSDGSQVASDTSRSSLYIVNNGSGKALRIDSSGSGSTSPLVVDTLGKMGIGTSTPNKQLHIYTGGTSNAEIDLQSNTTPGSHWGIYQNKVDGALRFWNGDDRLKISTAGDVIVAGNLNVLGSASGNGGLLWSSGNDGHNSGLDADTVDGKHNGELDAKYIGGYEMSVIDDGFGGVNPKICVKSGNCTYSTASCIPKNSITAKHSCDVDSDCNSFCAGIAPSSLTCDYNCNGNYSSCDSSQTDHVWGSKLCTTLAAVTCLDSGEYPPVGACVCNFTAAAVSYRKATVTSTWFCAATIPQ